jgi:hypothetical protein
MEQVKNMVTGNFKFVFRRESGSRKAGMLVRAAALIGLLACMPVSHADVFGEGDRVMVEVGPYVYHFENNTDHNQWPRLIGVEYEAGSHWLGGLATFKNSYSQETQFLYLGKRWFIDSVDENLYVKIAGGLVHGYKEPYDDKLPINSSNGYGFAILPAVGYQFGRANAQLILIGTIGAVITFGYDFWN